MEFKTTYNTFRKQHPKSRQHLRSMSDDFDNRTNTLFMSSDSYRPENISILIGVDVKKNENKLIKFKKKLNLNIIKPIHRLVDSLSETTCVSSSLPNLPKLKPEKRKNNFIPFTKVRSPLSVESREMNLYKRIFYYFAEKKKKFKRDQKKYVNNKINIDYADSEEAYEQRLIKRNIKLLEKGEKIKHFSGPTFSEIKLNELQNKVKFIKSVTDYSYPDMVLFKVQQSEKMLKIKNKNYKILEPFKQKDLQNQIQQKYLKDYLNDAIVIQKV